MNSSRLIDIAEFAASVLVIAVYLAVSAIS